MDKNSNLYILIYAAVLTILVAVILAVVSDSLKPNQMANELVAKKSDILRSVGVADVENVEEYFSKNIEGLAINYAGETIDTVEAIDLDLSDQYAIADETKRVFPLYVYKTEAGNKNYIIPLEGNGLWGPIWGYVALDEDLNTIVGASFDHKTETPGLGAEIAGEKFQNTFRGKEIFDGDEFVGVEVKKGNLGDVQHQVQAISGATITGDGVTAMIKKDLANYLPYFEKLKNQ